MEFVSPCDGPYLLVEGKKYLDFSSCDFLGLAQHPEVKKAAIKYVLKYGVGIPAAPLGSSPQQQLEAKLAHYLGTETALIFPSMGEVEAAIKGDLISAEEMEGKPKKSACMDESFTIGTMGHQGFGIAAHQSKYDLICGSLANGVGCSGAFVAGSRKALAPLAPTTQLNFATLGALDSAFSFIPEMEHEREMLQKYRTWLDKLINGFPKKVMKSPRIFMEFKSNKDAEKFRQLFAEDLIYLAPAQENTLYIAITALHTPDDFDQLSTSFKKFAETDLALSMQSLTPTP